MNIAAVEQAGRDSAATWEGELGWGSGPHAERSVILVDSSVWIDYFRGVENRQTVKRHGLLGGEPVAVGNLIPAEG